ncbi:isocitrate lyase/phosphoenolpyruvate mutase family protein [Sphingomonas sp. CGMCC 1.13654]|uniref:Isocitrate lyase/phosphoenolpyruvate mutase family protein n=1 Tax=Sphingomonas chungangi TaxID=2683589 RepID=A0A838L1D5_9SPHN|nr:isocitrate lyase/phosphoenolpyruvate mutase family protein [Sphingomonas chungangi]MBA2932750.1 isocitrate lyase/phosphoenolpyruvate mutase family protein [Sphingomonas chungangi]MVW56372.1 isocitrate lyase/phosphoenolpyruvate mutase family protein [Sphingomonas chungangi]
MPTVAETRAAFRALHQQGFFIIPNAWDGGSAVRLARLGFKAIASTSAGAAWAEGRQDGELSLEDVLAHLRMLVGATDLPVNADFENGFADDPDAVARNVALAVDTGVAGVSIEDWSGHHMYDLAHAVDRIAAARAAIDAVDPAVMLIGRNENFRVPEMSAADSIARAVAYAEAGADCLFVPFILDPGAVAELVAAVAPKPVNVVIHDYDASVAEFARIGVRRCSVGGSLAGIVWEAFDAAAARLKVCEPA